MINHVPFINRVVPLIYLILSCFEYYVVAHHQKINKAKLFIIRMFNLYKMCLPTAKSEKFIFTEL